MTSIILGAWGGSIAYRTGELFDECKDVSSFAIGEMIVWVGFVVVFCFTS